MSRTGLKRAEDPKTLKRVTAPFSDAEIEEIDTWGFSRRIRDRSTAIRELLKAGLAATSEAARSEPRRSTQRA